MKMSAKSRYGMLGLIDVIKKGNANVADIAQEHNISKKFLESCFNELRKANLLVSKSGSGGGYRQAKKSEDISIYDVFSCLEGDAKIAQSDFDGSEIKEFIFENVWDKINEKIESDLKSISIKDVM